MISAIQVKEQLTVDDIIKFVTEDLGSNGFKWDNQYPVFQTVCHNAPGDGSYKLYYYPDSRMFHCYTQCSDSFDIFELVQRAKHLDTFVEAFEYVKKYFNIIESGFKNKDATESTDLATDWDILTKHKYYQKLHEQMSQDPEQLPAINENILDYFGQPCLPQPWKTDHISLEAAYKFGIRVDPASNKIIIPHRDQYGKLVGIRGRSFDPIDICAGKKYMPVTIQGVTYKHPLGSCLYGLYENIEAIKKHKKIMIVESEKAVMQTYSYYKDECFAVATCGSSLSEAQISMILQLGVDQVILAYDRENDKDPTSVLTKNYEAKLVKTIKPLSIFANTFVIFDTECILPYKASPTDCGKEILEKLLDQKKPYPNRLV